jgi:3-oxoacyl-[acyl-carrier-protein] synthase-1
MTRQPAAVPRLHLISLGAQAPIGLGPRSIAAAVRAKVNRFRESHWLRRKSDGTQRVMSLLLALSPSWTAYERMRHLGIEAAMQALAPLLQAEVWPAGTAVPMVFSVPPHRPGLAQGSGAKLAREIMSALPLPPDTRYCGIFDTGQEGGLAALAYATELVAHRKAEVCLVGGVESFHDAEVLDWLEALGRLKSDDTPNGFIPGEAAAFLLVCGERFLRRSGLPSLGQVTAPVRASEPNPWYLGQPALGEGLTEAVRGALVAGLPSGERAGVTWCDLNGENWRADEWGFAYLRTSEHHGEPLRIRHPAEALGDLGAATGCMLVLLAALDLAHPRTEAKSALVFAMSDTRPHRSACMVLMPQEERS